ncbi:MAG: hypothetical protein V3R85_02805 [Alphaproteobacteria bacterium]
MNDITRRDALERRYDGPIPSHAAMSPDVDCDLETQIANRKRWAWRHIRAVGHDLVRAGRDFRATGSTAAFHRWTGLRRDLAHALQSWVVFRDWQAALVAERNRRAAA